MTPWKNAKIDPPPAGIWIIHRVGDKKTVLRTLQNYAYDGYWMEYPADPEERKKYL